MAFPPFDGPLPHSTYNLKRDIERITVATLGRRLFGLVGYTGELTLLLADACRWLGHPSTWRARRLLGQIERVGWGSLPIVSAISLTIGVAVAFQIAYQLQKLGLAMPIYTASFSALMIFREIGPVLTALIVAGRVGASIAAEIGMMRNTEQIDALRALAASPVKVLVVPRLLALLLGLPLLTVYGNALGVLGGFLVGTTYLDLGPQLYVEMSSALLALTDLWTGLLKSVVFAVVIAVVSCHEGLCTEAGAEGVGRATTRAVVIAFALVIASDALITGMFYFMGT